ncbi:MAG: hypothetical protein P8X83_00260 [Nitrosopumilaceae archaeon]
MKKPFLLLFFLILIPNSVFGIADIENNQIIAESKEGDIVLSLEFGENQLSKFGKLIPTLQKGVLLFGDSIVEIENARTKLMGNSFVVHSENILIYAQGLGNDQYRINSYLVGNHQLDPIKLESIPNQEIKIMEQENLKSLETIVLVQQDIRTFWNDVYDIEIKVFDKTINPNPKVYESRGAIEGADIKVNLKNIDGKEISQLTGKTNSKGFWEGDYFVLQNLVSGGTYTVEVNVSYLDSNNFQQLETIIVSDTSPDD